ncbi:transcriptional regulator family protein [Lapidilactobacillus concavus DSM 17758]|uniref:Transcriptional regulator family protein n=1 Tax=Lapidilactobacillus concavus DSM 17758 TaxID=1423735 RepID=A0A0R1WFI6_9LACO|nr:Rrf2 family transcriptional regulator [Lapidilactobacillus concavus]KRM13654.1 transcriptional regulator family protein [Lapidilactobacillus concavus DSM 17758]GEL12894.1 transcriptional regulator [Lapidilactobacillus concavus]
MKYSHRLSDAIHILAFVVIYADDNLSSRAIAASIQSNPSLIRRLMARLVKADLLVSRPGMVAPHLSRPADQISLLDIYRAVDDEQTLLHLDLDTDPLCVVGGNIQGALGPVYQVIQTAAEQKMSTITLQQIIDEIQRLAHEKGQGSVTEAGGDKR